VGELEEDAGAAAVVEQPAAAAIREQRAEAVHDHLVPAPALARVAAGEEAVVATLVELAEPLGPDPRMAVQEPAIRAAHHVVAPAPVAPLRREQRLHPLLPAERAADDLLDVAQADALCVLGAGHRRRAGEPELPAGLVHRGGGRHRVGTQLRGRHRPPRDPAHRRHDTLGGLGRAFLQQHRRSLTGRAAGR
jgi:hypothetical protein